MSDRPDPAKPTRTMPVLVTGGSVAFTDDPAAATAPAAADMPADADEAGLVVFVPPPIAPAPAFPSDAGGEGYLWVIPEDEGLLLHEPPGAVAGGVEGIVPPPVTVITTMGLPGPHFAAT